MGSEMCIRDRILSLALVVGLLFSCQPAVQSEPEVDLTTYNLNLATAQKFFATFSSEDLEVQKPLLCPGVTHYAPFLGSEPAKMDAMLANSKGWMDNFDDISYGDSKWFPGTDDSGKPNGSVMTSGSWTATSIATGNVVTVSAFHTFVFNAKNQIHEVRDYFDATGVMAAAMASILSPASSNAEILISENLSLTGFVDMSAGSTDSDLSLIHI